MIEVSLSPRLILRWTKKMFGERVRVRGKGFDFRGGKRPLPLTLTLSPNRVCLQYAIEAGRGNRLQLEADFLA